MFLYPSYLGLKWLQTFARGYPFGNRTHDTGWCDVLRSQRRWSPIVLEGPWCVRGCSIFSANSNLADAAYTPILIMWGVSNMVLDGAIAGLLCYYLHNVLHPLPPYPDIDWLVAQPTSPGAA